MRRAARGDGPESTWILRRSRSPRAGSRIRRRCWRRSGTLIFFTGSPPVGKIVHQAAAKNLTPAVLELGGKNPTIVHSSAELKTAAHRIAFTRFINSGHICTAPDHVLVWPEVKDELVEHLKQAIHTFYGDDPKQSPDYGRVINRKNFDRLVAFLDNGTVVAGGESDPDELYIALIVLVDVPVDSPIMQDEVFGPILPVLETAGSRHIVFLARWPSRQAMQHARDRLRELTARDRLRWPVEQVVADLNRFLRGWAGYFRHGNSTVQFDRVTRHAERRLQLWIAASHQQPWHYGRAAFNTWPDRYGLVSLDGTIAAPRPNRPWRQGAECRR